MSCLRRSRISFLRSRNRRSDPMKWTTKQERALLDGIGSFGWSVLERRTGHTRNAIWAKVQRDLGGGGITRGSYSLAQAMEETGYSRTQFERAASALNQRWQRTARGGNYLITAEQIEDIAHWLAQDFWCVRHRLYGCGNCATTSRPHHAGGLCRVCYHRAARFTRRVFRVRFTPEDLLDYVQKRGGSEERVVKYLESGRFPPFADLVRLSEGVV